MRLNYEERINILKRLGNNMERRVILLTPDRRMFDRLLREYPERIMPEQINRLGSSAGMMFYEIKGLNFNRLMDKINSEDEFYDICEIKEGCIYDCFRRIGDEIDLSA